MYLRLLQTLRLTESFIFAMVVSITRVLLDVIATLGSLTIVMLLVIGMCLMLLLSTVGVQVLLQQWQCTAEEKIRDLTIAFIATSCAFFVAMFLDFLVRSFEQVHHPVVNATTDR